jgi:hypothetical protein
MLDPLDYLSQEEEKERYKNHNNDVNDPRYQKFVSPIVEKVRDHYDTNHLGLDYGYLILRWKQVYDTCPFLDRCFLYTSF